MYAYLKKRGVSPQIIRSFISAGLLYEDSEHHNCVFVGYDRDGKAAFASLRGTYDRDGSGFKGDAAGSDKSIGFRLPYAPDSRTVYVFEAPIDLMSYCTLHREFHSNALALCCLDDRALSVFLREHPTVRKVVLCLDHDRPGQEAAERMGRKYAAEGYAVQTLSPPSRKDWNAYLTFVQQFRERGGDQVNENKNLNQQFLHKRRKDHLKSKTTRHGLKRMTALLLAVVLCVGMVPTAFAAQQDSYHDPAENWQEANNRTNELDANATVTHETFNCKVCKQQTSFIVFRTPEYTRDGQTAMSRNVKYSDGTFVDGSGKGSILDGVPGEDAYYTGYHWTKAVCETCGSINTNMAKTDYGYLKNVYWLYDCANNFFEELPETQTIEQADSEYHRVITTSGEYCGFCYGTFKEENSTLERHHMENAIRPELAHDRFVEMDTCADCGYAETSYTAAKAVIADYFGVVDGQPHTVTVSDLSEAGVTTAIRYGHSADACTLTSAPNYTEAGDYPVYYEITYTYHDTDMVEDGVAYVHLRDETTTEDGSCTCGCGNPDCGCQDPDCDGCCCDDKGCGENHNWTLLDSVAPTCLTLGYDRYLCVDCGMIEKRDYEAALGHAYQSVVVRDATCEVPGKTIDICERCGNVKETDLPQTEHEFSTTVIPATCTSPGYTLRECTVCGERHIEDITAALPHNYVSKDHPGHL